MMATLTVYGVNDEVLHEEEIKTGSAQSARRVTKKGARVALDTPGARVVVATKRGDEDRKIVEINGQYFTRTT
jgi:stress response protein YsnF